MTSSPPSSSVSDGSTCVTLSMVRRFDIFEIFVSLNGSTSLLHSPSSDRLSSFFAGLIVVRLVCVSSLRGIFGRVYTYPSSSDRSASLHSSSSDGPASSLTEGRYLRAIQHLTDSRLLTIHLRRMGRHLHTMRRRRPDRFPRTTRPRAIQH